MFYYMILIMHGWVWHMGRVKESVTIILNAYVAYGCKITIIFLLNHNSATYLRNRYAQSLQLGFVLAGGFCHSPFVVKSDDALAA